GLAMRHGGDEVLVVDACTGMVHEREGRPGDEAHHAPDPLAHHASRAKGLEAHLLLARRVPLLVATRAGVVLRDGYGTAPAVLVALADAAEVVLPLLRVLDEVPGRREVVVSDRHRGGRRGVDPLEL